jgi:hypothetical protein
VIRVPCAPACPVCVPCVSRLPPVSFYRHVRSRLPRKILSCYPPMSFFLRGAVFGGLRPEAYYMQFATATSGADHP